MNFSFLAEVVENMTVVNCAFHQHRGTGWNFTPTPDQNGRISFTSDTFTWVTWSGRSHEPVTFDLGMSGVKLEKIEFTSKFVSA